MQRGRRVAVVAHCLLDVNAKVKGLARYPGVHPEMRELIADDAGLIQLPCPEVTYLGMRRWGMTREQYDVPTYRRHCVRLLEPVVDTLKALDEDGGRILGVWGVDGSPSCGVSATCTGYDGGELDQLDGVPVAARSPGEGVFIEEFREACAAAGLEPEFRAVDEIG